MGRQGAGLQAQQAKRMSVHSREGLGWGRWWWVFCRAPMGAMGHGGEPCAQASPSDSHVHWVMLVEEASKEPFTAKTCRANLLPASR